MYKSETKFIYTVEYKYTHYTRHNALATTLSTPRYREARGREPSRSEPSRDAQEISRGPTPLETGLSNPLAPRAEDGEHLGALGRKLVAVAESALLGGPYDCQLFGRRATTAPVEHQDHPLELP